mgnify:CR=1 FL=1
MISGRLVGLPGLIPAHAGKTLTSHYLLLPARAHPRSRGENVAGELRLRVAKGSSPLTRGKPRGTGLGHLRPGLIPAHAGKTRFGPPPWPHGRAHPRSRGENASARRSKPSTEGSSPLTRGKRIAVPRASNLSGSSPLTRGKRPQARAPPGSPGLIPAHAGKTGASLAAALTLGAHPRSRGENQQERERWRVPAGLIPAHAGKTSRRPRRTSSSGAHPRSRGENLVLAVVELLAGGSSPLTRGKRASHRSDR